ncbi:MAG: hypothetical protein KC912_15630 [Proteobacteria bacterium]|nr:hypothetical protein [Pseudomonadota bacterium]
MTLSEANAGSWEALVSEEQYGGLTEGQQLLTISLPTGPEGVFATVQEDGAVVK